MPKTNYDWKHLTLEQRKITERCLDEGQTLKEIAESIHKDPRTLSKEIKKRRSFKSNEERRFRLHADLAKLEPCRTLARFPFVCNGCDRRGRCRLDNYLYEAGPAHEEYRKTLSDSRDGLSITSEEYAKLDAAVKAGTEKGQSIYAICQSSSSEVPYTPRNVYYLIDEGKLSTKPLDLRRKVKMRPRKKYDYRKKETDRAAYNGRELADYFRFMLAHPGTCPVQMDTVEGKNTCHKVFLTLHWVDYHFMLVILIERQTPECVTAAIEEIYGKLGNELFRKMFPCILTDRGIEFIDPVAIEADPETGEARTQVFFCDAYISSQKGAIEKGHGILRYIAPKGLDTDVLDASCGPIITNEIANYPRLELSGLAPIDVMLIMAPEFVQKMGLKKVDPTKVNLTPSLLVRSK